MIFEWDAVKADSNVLKHGVYFEDAARVFLDSNRIERYDGRDPNHGEDRYVTMGYVDPAILVVVYTVRGEDDIYRLISARKANKDERKEYEAKRR